MAILLEHYAGTCRPGSVRTGPGPGVRDDTTLPIYVAETLALEGVRAASKGRMNVGARIRKAKLEKIPYILVSGRRRRKGHAGCERARIERPERGVSVAEFRARLLEEIATHGSPETVSGLERFRRRGARTTSRTSRRTRQRGRRVRLL